MNQPPPGLDTAAQLRAAFDASFAASPAAPRRDVVNLLCLRAGGQHLAVRLLEATGLVALGPVVAVPSRRPELLGVTGLRGELVPVFHLARLLGLPEQPVPPRWMILAGGGERVGLAFDDFEGHVRVVAGDLHPAGADRLPELAHLPDRRAPVLGIKSILQALTGR